jgi:hypothetical protein
LKEKVAGLEIEIMAVGIRRTDHVTPLYAQKLALTSPTSGGRSVGMVRSRTKTTELLVIIFFLSAFLFLSRLILSFLFFSFCGLTLCGGYVVNTNVYDVIQDVQGLVTSGELLRKRAMRKKIILYKTYVQA